MKIKPQCKIKELPPGLREQALAQIWPFYLQEDVLERSLDIVNWIDSVEGYDFWLYVCLRGEYDGRYESEKYILNHKDYKKESPSITYELVSYLYLLMVSILVFYSIYTLIK